MVMPQYNVANHFVVILFKYLNMGSKYYNSDLGQCCEKVFLLYFSYLPNITFSTYTVRHDYTCVLDFHSSKNVQSTSTLLTQGYRYHTLKNNIWKVP